MGYTMADEYNGYSGDATTIGVPGEAGWEPRELSHEAPRVLSPADQAMVEALRPNTALLIALSGPNSGARFLLDADEVSAGRHPKSDIFFDDITVSRRHAIFVRSGNGYSVQDIGSLNGTYVDRKLVDNLPLVTGAEVMIGKYRLTYYAAAHSAPEQS